MIKNIEEIALASDAIKQMPILGEHWLVLSAEDIKLLQKKDHSMLNEKEMAIIESETTAHHQKQMALADRLQQAFNL